MKRIETLIKKKQGIKLDAGCGTNRQPGFITLDRQKLPNVDIVWDLQKFPYPLPPNCCIQILSSHVWEHIEPKYRVSMMNEFWRIMKDKGQLWISSPYYLSFGANQDPTHYTCPNEATFAYFDQGHDLFKTYKPKPWKILRNDYQLTGSIEIILEAIKS